MLLVESIGFLTDIHLKKEVEDAESRYFSFKTKIFFQINLVDKKRRYTFAASNKKRNRDILRIGEEKRKSSLFF